MNEGRDGAHSAKSISNILFTDSLLAAVLKLYLVFVCISSSDLKLQKYKDCNIDFGGYWCV